MTVSATNNTKHKEELDQPLEVLEHINGVLYRNCGSYNQPACWEVRFGFQRLAKGMLASENNTLFSQKGKWK